MAPKSNRPKALWGAQAGQAAGLGSYIATYQKLISFRLAVVSLPKHGMSTERQLNHTQPPHISPVSV